VLHVQPRIGAVENNITHGAGYVPSRAGWDIDFCQCCSVKLWCVCVGPPGSDENRPEKWERRPVGSVLEGPPHFRPRRLGCAADRQFVSAGLATKTTRYKH
jgi:hypothetical protein